MLRPDDDAQIESLALLRDPLRREIYRYVAGSPAPVGRDEVATAVEASRSLVAFHLDKLVAEGLLCTSFRRLSGRSGPGAGRPAKLYARSDRQLEISLPAREYELAAQLLLRAVDSSGGTSAIDGLHGAARDLGLSTGARTREEQGAPRGRAASLERLQCALADLGYSPYVDGGALRLRNCPFHSLAAQSTSTVCGMNLALIEGVLEGLKAKGLSPGLAPGPDRCCVEVTPGDSMGR